MDQATLEQQIAAKRQSVGQRIADIPNVEAQTREGYFGSDYALGQFRAQEASKVRELFEHDKAVAAQYQTPPEQGMVLDPYIRELQLTNRYRGTQEDLSGIRQNIGVRQDILGDAVSRAMELILKGVEAEKYEVEGLESDLDRLLKQKSGGGAGASQAYVNSLFENLRSLDVASTPETTGTTSRARTMGDTLSALKKQYKSYLDQGYTLDVTPYGKLDKSKKGRWSYSLRKPDQEFIDPKELELTQLQLLNQAPKGVSESDISRQFETLFPDIFGKEKKLTARETKSQVKAEAISDIQQAPKDMDYEALLQQMVQAYPELSTTEIEDLLYTYGF